MSGRRWCNHPINERYSERQTQRVALLSGYFFPPKRGFGLRTRKMKRGMQKGNCARVRGIGFVCAVSCLFGTAVRLHAQYQCETNGNTVWITRYLGPDQ